MNEPLSSADVSDLKTGHAFQNSACTLQASATSDLETLHLTDLPQPPIRQIHISFRSTLETPEPMVTQFYPRYQETIYGSEGLILTKRIFVPGEDLYPAAACWLIEVQAESHRLMEVIVRLETEPGLTADLESGLLVGTTPEGSSWVFGSNGPPVRVTGLPGTAPEQTPSIELSYLLLVEGTVEHPLVLSLARNSRQMAWNGYLSLLDVETAWKTTVQPGPRTVPQQGSNGQTHGGNGRSGAE